MALSLPRYRTCAAVGAVGLLRSVAPTRGRACSVTWRAVSATAGLGSFFYALAFGAEQGFLRCDIAVAAVSVLR